jgi:CDP-2,3-bis-(O-geranylgeranyl)-sn-glycerol synthase
MVETIYLPIAVLITTLYFLLPAYLSNSSGLIFGGGIPVDFGKTDKKGVRLIGDGCTWRGLIAGAIVGTLVGAIQGYFGPYLLENFGEYILTPICSNLHEGIIVGFLLGFGALLGDAIGSYIKRRIGIQRGRPAPILDQLDFIIMGLILVLPIIHLSLDFIILSCILTLIIHLLANTIAYLIGIKDVWY